MRGLVTALDSRRGGVVADQRGNFHVSVRKKIENNEQIVRAFKLQASRFKYSRFNRYMWFIDA